MAIRKEKPRHGEHMLDDDVFNAIDQWFEDVDQIAVRAITSTEEMRCEALEKWADSTVNHWLKVRAVIKWLRVHLNKAFEK